MEKPTVISTRDIYKGKIFDVIESDIRHDDVQYKREIVVHKGSAVIVPLFEDGTIAFVRQYRYAAEKFLLEVPAGTLNKDEDPRLGAIRELEEEIGVRAGHVEKLAEFYVSPGFLTEKMHLYLATDLTATKQALEIDEILSIERHSIADALRMIQNGEIEDAKTIIAVTLVAGHQKSSNQD